jgi:hypothetical protein
MKYIYEKMEPNWREKARIDYFMYVKKKGCTNVSRTIALCASFTSSFFVYLLYAYRWTNVNKIRFLIRYCQVLSCLFQVKYLEICLKTHVFRLFGHFFNGFGHKKCIACRTLCRIVSPLTVITIFLCLYTYR